MKQVTEFHGLLLQNAVKATAHLTPPAKTASAAAPVPAPATSAPASEAPAAPEEPPAQAAAEETTPAEPETAPAPAEAAAPEAGDAHAAYRAELERTIAQALKLEGERLQRMSDAVELFGSRAQKVRLVRVFRAGEAPQNAKVVGDFAYVADFVAEAGEGKHGRRGGRKGGRGGPRREGGGAPSREEPGSLRGSFSMDALKEDRKSRMATADGRRKGGPGGPGGRRRPGGGGGPSGRGRGGPGAPAGRPGTPTHQ